MSKPILCLDFDGVLHSYTSGWVEIDFIPDPPVPGALRFLRAAMEYFEVAIFSSRSRTPEGRRAMATWIDYWAKRELSEQDAGGITDGLGLVGGQLQFPDHKPSAMVTIDDRAVTFTGEWPAIADLLAFQPWNKGPHNIPKWKDPE